MGQFSIEYEDGLTDDQVMALFDQDLGDLDAEVDRRLSSPASLNQNQFDALCCFTFNVGLDAFTKSTLLRVINEGMLDQVPTQMRRWIFDNGVKVAGLQNRRDKEILIWEGLV
jgi:lysozyme